MRGMVAMNWTGRERVENQLHEKKKRIVSRYHLETYYSIGQWREGWNELHSFDFNYIIARVSEYKIHPYHSKLSIIPKPPRALSHYCAEAIKLKLY
jgi:hypothetical protein